MGRHAVPAPGQRARASAATASACVIGVWRAVYGRSRSSPVPMRPIGRKPAGRTACWRRRAGIAGRKSRSTRCQRAICCCFAGGRICRQSTRHPDRARPLRPCLSGQRGDGVGARAAVAQAPRRRVRVSRPSHNQLIAGELPWQPYCCRPRARSWAGCSDRGQRHRRRCRRLGGLHDRPGADRQHAAHRGAAPDRRATVHGRGGRVDPAHLRHGARRRHPDLGDALRGGAHHAPAGRQGRRPDASPSTAISPMSPSRCARARSPASAGSGPTGARSTAPRSRCGCTAAAKDQDADPLIEAKQGDGNTPAYRGVAYVVFERFALADYGNRIPQFQFEVLRPVGVLRRKGSGRSRSFPARPNTGCRRNW